MELTSLNEFFQERILRIPDYQRGYAWSEHQYGDFWDDLIQLEDDRVHYTGLITLERVPEKVWRNWENDRWIIDDVGYKPFYIVDGQQRLTTSMILIQAITEKMNPDEYLCSKSRGNIQKKFILEKADDGLRESYIFGYEKDNPSDEFLKTRVFCMSSSSDLNQETLYTRNLINAKKYFQKKLEETPVDDIGRIYKKLTQYFRFNLYEIDDEIDVFVTFETMNNRGKSLTSLELLKNRLIYLSTLYKDNQGREKLRTDINNVWKTIYEYLGKNPDNSLSDELFLRNHWTMYFKYSRRKGNDYIKFLLDEKFTARAVQTNSLKITDIYEYVQSLQESIIYWFLMHNPFFNQNNKLDGEQALLLDRLNRLGFKSFKPLILAAFVTKQETDSICKLLVVCERYNFTLFNISQRRSNTGDTEFFSMARGLLLKEIKVEKVVCEISGWIDRYYDPEKFMAHIRDKYELGRDGFYHWDGVRYFLYEYEQHLKTTSKSATEKLSWNVLVKNKADSLTIEHIFPQTPTDTYWVEKFVDITNKNQRFLTHSLGNLVPLSRAKNSSMQNYSFKVKKKNGQGVGYFNGSCSEIEVSCEPEWLPENIAKRGIILLEFMEKRWNICLGDDAFKRKLLHTDML